MLDPFQLSSAAVNLNNMKIYVKFMQKFEEISPNSTNNVTSIADIVVLQLHSSWKILDDLQLYRTTYYFCPYSFIINF